MSKMTRLVRGLAAAGLLAAPIMAQHPRPQVEHIHLLPAGSANPSTMDIKNASAAIPKDRTQFIDFDKPAGGPFTVTFSGRSPCVETAIGSVAGASARCTLKPGPTLCRKVDANYDQGKAACVFAYSLGKGDPDIVIDPGYNPPPPPPTTGKGKKKSPTPKK